MNIDKLLEEFKTYKVDVEGKAEDSINLYIKNIKKFCEDMNIKDYETLISTKSQTIKDWLSILAEKENSAVTRNNKLSAIKQIFCFLEDEKDVVVDRKINKIKYAKTKQKETKYLDEKQMEELLAITTNQRTKSAIAILNNTGVRFSELIQITCTDIERGFAIIVGKGNKERTIFFTHQTIAICRNFINGKRRHIVEKYNLDTDLLFLSDYGNIMKASNFINSLKYYAERMGIYWSNEMSPHKLRHSCITKALNDGVPIQVVRDMVGHTNMQTTNRYSHSKDDEIRKAMLREDFEEE